MPTARETVNSLYGAYRLARFDAAGMNFFEVSIGGFWRSFHAAAIIAPLFGTLLFMRFSAGLVDAGAWRFAAVEAIAYVIAWVAFPLIMVPLSKLIERQERYLGFIVAYNWAAVLQNAIYLPLAIMATGGIVPADTANALGLIVLMMILIYTWFIATAALKISAAGAAGIVALDLVLSIFINAISESML